MSKSQRNSQSVNRLDSIILGSSEMSDVKHVASVEALRDLSGRYDGQQISLTSYYAGGTTGGGFFKWDAASTAADDGGLVIAVTGVATGRWVRDAGYGVSPRMFGAVGDNETDDHAAITAALPSVYIDLGEGNYVIKSMLQLVSAATQLYGPRIPSVGRVGRNTNIFCDFEAEAAIRLANSNCAFGGFSLDRASASGPDAGIDIVQNESAATPSRDAAVIGMQFLFFPTCLNIVGRGLTFSNNEIAGANVGVNIDWLEGFEDVRENTHGTQGGFRNFTISNNRVHTCETALVQNIGNNRKWISAIQVSDNVFDIGGGVFKGVLRRGQVTNNTVNLARAGEVAVELWGDSREYIIDNLFFAGAFKPEGDYEMIRSLPNYMLQMRGPQTDGSIGTIVASWIARQAVRIEADAVLSNITIDKLIARDVALDNPAFGVIVNLSGSTGEIRIKEIQVSATDVPASPVPIIFGATGVNYILDSVPKYDPAKFTLRSGGRVYVPFKGRINADGTLVNTPPFVTAVKDGTGVWTVTHSLGIASAAECIITASAVSTSNVNVTVAATSSGFTVRAFNAAGAAVDTVINFDFTTTKN